MTRAMTATGILTVGEPVLPCRANCGRCGDGLLFSARDQAAAESYLREAGWYRSRKYGWCHEVHRGKRRVGVAWRLHD